MWENLVMLDWHTYLIILPVVFFAGIVDAIAGGGGLISVPAYLAAGLPPHFALATNKFSSVFGTLFATARYFRHGMIDLKIALGNGLLALVGSWLGTRTVLILNPGFLNIILVILIPIIAVFSLVNKNMGKHNSSHELTMLKKVILSSIFSFIIGFYDGFFGPGTGSFLIICYVTLLQYDFVVANGNTKVVNLSSNLGSVITFLISGKVIFAIGIPAAICGIAGNLLGSKLVVKKGGKIIRPLFLFVLVLLLVKIIYNLLKS